jgi:hypothetical protein
MKSLTHLVQKMIAKVKFFTIRSKFKIKVTRSNILVQNENFMRYLYVKYQNPIPHGSKDIAQVKVFSLR